MFVVNSEVYRPNCYWSDTTYLYWEAHSNASKIECLGTHSRRPHIEILFVEGTLTNESYLQLLNDFIDLSITQALENDLNLEENQLFF